MRDIALSAVFAFVLVKALRHTWIGVLLWTWFSFMNPHRMTYGFAYGFPFAAIAAGATLISLVPARKENHFPSDPAVVMLIVFSLWMCLTTLFAILPERSLEGLDRALKIQLMTLVAIVAIRSRKQIEYFLWVIVASLGYFGVKGGAFTLASGGASRVWGPAGALIEGNNEIGLALVMVIPLMNYLRVISPRVWVRRGMLAAMVLSSAAVLGTQSRGAFLAIVAMGLVLWFRSSKKVLGGIAIVTASVLLVIFMPASWEERMRTIQTYQMDASAQGRLTAWQTALNIANDRITGGGFQVATRVVWDKYSPNPDWVLTAHSIYFQAIGEQGWIGLAIFLSLGFFGCTYASQMRKVARQRPETLWLYELGGMLQVSMVGYAVGGAFLSLTYFDLPYSILVVIIACRHWVRQERWRTETTGAFGASAPAGQGTARLQTATAWY